MASEAYTTVALRKPLYARMAAVVNEKPGHYASVPDLIAQLFNMAYPDPAIVTVPAAPEGAPEEEEVE